MPLLLFFSVAPLFLFLAGCSWPHEAIPQDDFERARLHRPPEARAPAKRDLGDFPEIAWHPDSYRVVQRIVLQARGKQYDFVGYLRVRGPGDFRALGLGEMGGILFDFSLANGQPRILKKPENMPPDPLLDGVIGDIRHVFCVERLRVSDYTRERRAEDTVLTLDVDTEKDSPQSHRYWFGGTGRLVHSEERWKGKTVRSADYRGWRTFPGCSRPLPERIHLENRRWRYKMEIQLLEFHQVP